MGAFGNYHQPIKYQIDYTHNKPIEVIANFNTEGKYKPEYFRYIADNDEQFTYKIDSIKYFREYDNYDLFCCGYTNHGKQYEILLRFHTIHCLWTLPI
jgi:hypothetical protein